MSIDKNGFEPCVACQEKYHISNTDTCETKTGAVICKKCWLDIQRQVSWGAKRRKCIVFDYVKQSIPHSLKWKIWKRDGFKCVKCGTDENLSIDHIKPESFGGTLEIENLQTLCKSCNSKKYNKYG